jgi:hypothetical protein
VVQLVNATADAELLPPPVRGMIASATDSPRAFACVGATCSAPAESVDAWNSTLDLLHRRTQVAT